METQEQQQRWRRKWTGQLHIYLWTNICPLLAQEKTQK